MAVDPTAVLRRSSGPQFLIFLKAILPFRCLSRRTACSGETPPILPPA